MRLFHEEMEAAATAALEIAVGEAGSVPPDSVGGTENEDRIQANLFHTLGSLALPPARVRSVETIVIR